MSKVHPSAKEAPKVVIADTEIDRYSRQKWLPIAMVAAINAGNDERSTVVDAMERIMEAIKFKSITNLREGFWFLARHVCKGDKVLDKVIHATVGTTAVHLKAQLQAWKHWDVTEIAFKATGMQNLTASDDLILGVLRTWVPCADYTYL